MKKNYLFPFLLVFGFTILSNQNTKAQSGLQYDLAGDAADQINFAMLSPGMIINIEIMDNGAEIVTVIPPESPKTTYFEDKDGDGYTSGKTIEDLPGLDIPGYKEIMFLDPGSIVQDINSGTSYWVFDCDDNNPNIIRGKFYYEDQDGDGYITNAAPITACERPEGYISEENIKGIDCDDTSFDAEKPTTTYYFDNDGDGYPSSFGEYCERPEGGKSIDELISTEKDCNDNNKDTWEELWYYEDADGDGYHGYSSVVCVGAEGPTRTAVINSIIAAGYVFQTLGPDCDDSDPSIGLYQPIKFVRGSTIGVINIGGCSIDDLENATRPAFNDSDDFITTTLEVLLEAGAKFVEGSCLVKRVRYKDLLYPKKGDDLSGSIYFRRTFVIVDNLDNISYFNKFYLIQDKTKPTIAPIDDLIVDNETGKCGASKENVLVSPHISDNCTLIGDLVISNNAPDFFEVGVHYVEWSVKDKAGNIQKAVQKVTIADTEAPIVKTKNITVALGPKGDAFVPYSSVDNGSTDNCGITSFNLMWRFSCSSLGDNTVTLTRRDAAGNVSSADAIIKVIDNTPPTWTTTMPDLTANCNFIPAPLAPVAVDNCDSEPEVIWYENSGQNPDPNNPGHYNYTITWTWRATDASGNFSEISQNVHVSDNVAPIIQPLKNIEARCDNIPEPTNPQVKDNCDPNPSVTFSESSNQNPDTSSAGHYNYIITRKWIAKDVSGNQSESIQLVNVVDDRRPEWVSLKSNMDITLYCGDESGLANAQSILPVVLDNCDQTPTITKTSGLFVPGPLPGQGSYTNTFIATDASGYGSSEFRQVISILPIAIDASESSTPVQLGTPATLKATVSPIAEGITVNFVLYNENGIVEVDEIQAVTDHTGIAATLLNDLALGVYKIVATVGTGCSESIAYLPVFDPNGNFVTGAGWIQSPKGAVVNQPEIEGKANFGFISKYKKGSNQVDGKTDFRFNAADIDFKSNFHESGSLVISGKKATYRGEGTINGISGYKFVLVAIDGDWNGGNDPDQYRIKISDSNGVIYDNQLGLDENSESSTIIGGGSIVIKETRGGKTKREFDIEENNLILDNQEQNIELAINVRAYPNPVTNGILILDFGDYSARNIHTTAIVDLTGKTIAVTRHEVIDQNTIELDVSMLKQGMYLIQVHGEGFFQVIKVIKK